MSDTVDHALLICSTCQAGRSVAAVKAGLAERLPRGFAVRTVDCMAGCAHPRTVGFQAVGKAQYLFGDIQTAQDVAALAAFAQQYFDSPDGWTNATDRPRALFNKTLSRLPGLPSGWSA